MRLLPCSLLLASIFLRYNMLDEKLEKYNPKTEQLKALGRSAFMGARARPISLNLAPTSLRLAAILPPRLPPLISPDLPPATLCRGAGFCASAVSDTCSNSIRVVKTTKQTSKESITSADYLPHPPPCTPPPPPPRPPRPPPCPCLPPSPSTSRAPSAPYLPSRRYMGALSKVVAADGISGLLFRGLVTKIISNGCQGILFSVLWRLGQDYLNNK